MQHYIFNTSHMVLMQKQFTEFRVYDNFSANHIGLKLLKLFKWFLAQTMKIFFLASSFKVV